MRSYHHTQIGWTIAVALLIALAILAGTALVLPESRPAAPWIAGFITVVLVLFSTLTVTVSGDCVCCHFGPGLIRRRIPLADLRRVEVVRNRWWYGWGIRLTPHGWLWNVSGLDAVEITFADGRRFRIGTDEPAALATALHRQLPGS